MTHLKKTSEHNRLVPTLVLVAVVLLATWMGAVNGGYYVGEWGLVALILAILALFASIAGMFHYTTSRWSMLALGLLGAYTAWTFASILWSPNQGDAWLGAGQTLLYLLVFWLAVGLVPLGGSRRWALAASVIGPAMITVLTLRVLLTHTDDLFQGGRLLGTVGYYNGEAAFLLVPFWVAMYLAGSPRVNPILRGLVLAGATLCAETGVLTQSRGALVAMGVSLPVFFLFSGQRLRGLFALAPAVAAVLIAFPSLNEVYLAFRNQESAVAPDIFTYLEDQESAAAAIEGGLATLWLPAAGAGLYGVLWGLLEWRWRPANSTSRVIAGVALASSIAVLVFGAVAVGERVGNPVTWGEQKWKDFKSYGEVDYRADQSPSRYLAGSGGGRDTLWQVAWKDFTSHPLVGVGTYNYEATYYRLREQDAGYLRQPHMLPLEVLSERGIVGGALFFGFLAVCLGAGLWARFSYLSAEGKGQVGAIVAAVTYWAVQSSVDWFWQLPAVTLPAIVYLAILVGPWKQVESAPLRWPLRLVGAGVALLALAATAPLYAADRYLAAHSDEGANPEEALAAVERARQLNPVSAELPQREAELAMQSGDWGRAEEAYREAARLNPEHYASYDSLAYFYEMRGDLATALSYSREALALNPLGSDVSAHTLQLLAQVPTQQSVPVSVISKKGGAESSRLSLMLGNSASDREHPLQGPVTLPSGVGILFAWPADISDPFWIRYATPPSEVAFIDARGQTLEATTPLEVAFIDAQGQILEVRPITGPYEEQMKPGDPYRMAIVANQGSLNTPPDTSRIVIAGSL